ncbi:DUF1905 domain-containing protein [Cellulomonas soli]
MTYEFEALLAPWHDDRPDAWVFVHLPHEVSDEIADVAAPVERGFGSVRVEATLGGSTWRTSLFPDSRRKTYSLPVKRTVRQAEQVATGDVVRVTVRLLDVPQG